MPLIIKSIITMVKNTLTIAIAILFIFSLNACNNSKANDNTTKTSSEATATVQKDVDPTAMQSTEGSQTSENQAEGKVHKINTATFINKIFDYKKNPKKWVYKGDKPAIIDFYADWCGPCKKVAPIMDELAKKYAGKVNFYKINTDDEKELSGSVFGIRSIPSILYIPVNGQRMMSTGLYPKSEYIKQIETNLLNKNK